ncbi:unnamed protein product [Diatraea saccharalis]|uniref:Uncharacterized protein n=1 Tax=Diatraea saccharalis TaxID=40085 RepID=A0A9N9WEY9_9NEOP|nr:unnamed protein product [Diatraea saccharalis]
MAEYKFAGCAENLSNTERSLDSETLTILKMFRSTVLLCSLYFFALTPYLTQLDDTGMLQKESVLDLARKVFDDEEEIKIIGDYLHSCGHINSEAVSDGAKGCERAMLALKCMHDNASKALSPEQIEEIQTKFVEVGDSCVKEHPLSEEDVKSFKVRKFPEGENAPCFSACVLRKIGFFDDAGNLSRETAIEHAKKIFKDGNEIKTVEEFIDTCSKVRFLRSIRQDGTENYRPTIHLN